MQRYVRADSEMGKECVDALIECQQWALEGEEPPRGLEYLCIRPWKSGLGVELSMPAGMITPLSTSWQSFLKRVGLGVVYRSFAWWGPISGFEYDAIVGVPRAAGYGDEYGIVHEGPKSVYEAMRETVDFDNFGELWAWRLGCSSRLAQQRLRRQHHNMSLLSINGEWRDGAVVYRLSNAQRIGFDRDHLDKDYYRSILSMLELVELERCTDEIGSFSRMDNRSWLELVITEEFLNE